MLALPHQLNGKAKGYVWYNPFITCPACLSVILKIAEQQVYILSDFKLALYKSLYFKQLVNNLRGAVLSPG